MTIGRQDKLVGNKYGYLEVLRYAGIAAIGNARLYECQCICGRVVKVQGGNLTRGNSKSCGCNGGLALKPNRYEIHGKITYMWANNTGMLFIIDTVFYPLIKGYAWNEISGGYLQATINGESVRLHRYIMDVQHVHSGLITIDHINGHREDNRLENLRPDGGKNSANRKVGRNNKSGVAGVSCVKSGKWRVMFRGTYIGLYNTMEEAAKVRRQLEIQHYGEYARDYYEGRENYRVL